MAENETVDEFVGKITSMVSKATGLSHVFEQDVLVKKLLDAVPDKYFQLIASIEQSVDLDSLMFEDAIERLKAFEERLRGRERVSNSKAEVRVDRVHKGMKKAVKPEVKTETMKTKMVENRGGQDCGSSHKGQRRTNYRQRGRKDRSQVQCYRCDEFGHFATMCPERMKKKEESNLNKVDDIDPSLFMIKGDKKTVLLNEENVISKRFETEPMEKDVWYLDNGASNHMTGKKAYFYELNEQKTGTVKFGDESCIDIRGKGSVLIEGKTGEQRLLTDVYYIPSLKCNIISLG
ncbi:uncharacterized protein LOC143541891 [Bidens hawaiensis]|uniref:uncharacterized protein LOC143541891 n=1 Tax=Bidens hawaiensis TaxID=980011 RepID=UPI0040499CC1